VNIIVEIVREEIPRKLHRKEGYSAMADKENLVVVSKVKEYIKAKNCMTASETISALNAKVCELLDAAVERTKANGRSTVKPQDL